jgi:hypothetical protein
MMTSHSPAERVLFADLTRLLLSMRDASYAEVEAKIEDRFRGFVREQAAGRAAEEVGGLQITFTWTLPDGADDWAVYATEYKTVPAEPRVLPQLAVAGGGAAVIEFPSPQIGRSVAANGSSARIIAFPGC